MRPGNNNNRRGRNRGPRKPHGGMPNKSQSFDGGSDTRVRGNVYQVLEKYLQLARDAGVAGDRVAAENFLQHADHYYRVITTMNDGQRPRVGGREISVADVNVQNVSQGLSAALYSGGPSQPNMSDGGSGNPAPQQGNGNPRGNEGFSGQGANSGNGQGNGAGEGADSNRADGEAGDYPQQGQQRGNRNRHQGRQGDYRQNDRQNDRQGGEFRDRNEQRNQPQAAEPVAAAEPPMAPVADEQPDYPEHLLPPAGEAAPEPAARASREPRTPRSRLRTRRPRTAEGEGDGAAEPAPAVEGGE
ncbi:DUF4167 domain-containing protein [Dongia sp.]|uniref:DUF4167 domain-containing protein n=1 Tax=Dongia sp. TaxID=1977262 RepID=UPI0035B35E09